MIKKIVTSIIALLLLAYTSSAWYFSSEILHLGLTPCNVEHFVFCGDPSTQDITFENVSFETVDGFTIPAWYMPANILINKENAEHVILLVHGRTASRHEGMRYAKTIIDAGYNVLAIDLRHPRQDPSIISTMGYHEQKDVLAALDYLENVKGFDSIGVMGFSMGAATSIFVMAKDPRIKVGVFNGSYANTMDVLSEQAAILYGLPRYPLIPLVELLFEWRGGLDSDEINPEKYIGQIAPRPIYIMHGTADGTVNFSHGERLFTAANEPKQFWKAEGGAHTRLWQFDKDKAESSVVEFFNLNLSRH